MGKVQDVFYLNLLHALKVPSWPGWLPFARCWQLAEGADAAHNPWNTEEHMPGSWNYNSVGVQNYPDEHTGVQATLQTLRRSEYANLLAAIEGHASPYYLAVEVARSGWGTAGWEFVQVLHDHGVGKTG